MISQEEVDSAFHYLNDSIEEYAQASAYLLGLEKLEKIILAELVLLSQRKTVSMKDAEARASGRYAEWRENIKAAKLDYETLKAKRLHADMVWCRWQSELSAIKQGVAL